MFSGSKKLLIVCGGTDKDHRTVRQTKDINSKVDLDSLLKAAAGPIAEHVAGTKVHNGYIHVMDGGRKVAALTIESGNYASLTLYSLRGNRRFLRAPSTRLCYLLCIKKEEPPLCGFSFYLGGVYSE